MDRAASDTVAREGGERVAESAQCIAESLDRFIDYDAVAMSFEAGEMTAAQFIASIVESELSDGEAMNDQHNNPQRYDIGNTCCEKYGPTFELRPGVLAHTDVCGDYQPHNPRPEQLRRLRLPNARAYDRAGTDDHSLFSEKHCCVCGKEVKAPRDWLLLSRAENGTFEFTIFHPSDAEPEERRASLWIAPIGTDCLRKHEEIRPFILPERRTATPQVAAELPRWANPNCGSCGGSGYTSMGGCYVCQKRFAETSSQVTEETPANRASSFKTFLAEQMKDQEFAEAWKVISTEEDRLLAQIAMCGVKK